MKKVLFSLIGAGLIFGSVATGANASPVMIESQVTKVVGTPYKFGGTTKKGFDCSGFILYILNKYGISLPRTSQTQAATGVKVAQQNLRVGDLVFFNTNGMGISHAGIYMGNNKFAHSSSSKGVRISSLTEPYYKNRYVTARRVTSQQVYNKMINHYQ